MNPYNSPALLCSTCGHDEFACRCDGRVPTADPYLPAVSSVEVLRSLSGDHDLLWLRPADLLVGDVLIHGDACVRTVQAPPVVMERGDHPADLWADGFVSVQVTISGRPWELPAGTSVLALRPAGGR